ncbi:MAG: sialate O-acetylesterase, partial [Verrucomicrobiota bacterium]
MKKYLVISLLLAFPLVAPHADLQPASIFSDRLILQREQPVAIWGTGTPGKTVEVRFAGQTVSAKVDQQGAWKAELKPMKASDTGRELMLSDGTTEITLKNVVVGEVWLAAGQSNMQMNGRNMVKKLPEAAVAFEENGFPQVRLLRINEPVAGGRRDDFTTAPTWNAANPESAKSFSAVAWVFGRRIHEELKVPIGLIDVSWGGKPIEPFIPGEAYAGHPLLKQIKALADEKKLDELAQLTGGVIIRNPEGYPGAIYDARMRPIAGFGLRGFLWYQAESNCGKGEDPTDYRHKQRIMIESWRAAWSNPELPVYYVQLPNFRKEAINWVRMREEQRLALKVPHTGMAVTIDTGSHDIHPANKIDVGQRLARFALRRDYGKEMVDSGPVYQAHKIEDTIVHVTFSHAEGGLMIGKKTG